MGRSQVLGGERPTHARSRHHENHKENGRRRKEGYHKTMSPFVQTEETLHDLSSRGCQGGPLHLKPPSPELPQHGGAHRLQHGRPKCSLAVAEHGLQRSCPHRSQGSAAVSWQSPHSSGGCRANQAPKTQPTTKDTQFQRLGIAGATKAVWLRGTRLQITQPCRTTSDSPPFPLEPSCCKQHEIHQLGILPCIFGVAREAQGRNLHNRRGFF